MHQMKIQFRRTDYDLEVNGTLRRLVVIFRVLAWVWMLILVSMTLSLDDAANRGVVIGAMGLATVWVGVTWWSARSGAIGTLWFAAVDGLVSVALGFATTVAGADDLFHGGMPMSWILVAAYAAGFLGAVPASIVLAAEQVAVHAMDGRGALGAAGSFVFIVFAVVVGWGFDALRAAEVRRIAAEEQLIEEQRARARQEERARLANRLHDSVLQSLLVVRRDADDSSRVRYLARREERRLRRAISDLRSEHENSFRSALLEVCDDVEDTYGIEVDSLIKNDVLLTEALRDTVQAVREALVNAAKHSGESRVDLYSEATPTQLVVHVRDRGRGFDEESRKRGGGFDNSLMSRVRDAGGSVSILTAPGHGTEVSITMELPE